MSKKVLVISSSPRKNGNTEALCERLTRGITDAGLAAVQFNVNDLTIHYCVGCGHCQTPGGSCFQQDDMARILAYMRDAEAAAFVTPVYFGGVSAQLKTLWDRTYALKKPAFRKAVFLAAAADSGASTKKAFQAYLNYISCLDVEDAGAVLANGVFEAGRISEYHLKKAYELGKSLLG